MPADNIWTGMVDISESLLLDKARPNSTLVEEALSFNAARLAEISDEKLRMYLIVLGQYLITLQYEENKVSAVCSSWQKVLDSHVYSLMNSDKVKAVFSGKGTLAEKRAWIVANDERAADLSQEYEVSAAKRDVIKNMHHPVEQYVNTLKKEVDARENEKRRIRSGS